MTDEAKKSEHAPLERVAATVLAAIFTIAAPLSDVEAATAGGGARGGSVSSGARVSTSVNTARVASMNASMAARNAAAANAARAANAANAARMSNINAVTKAYTASHAAQAEKSANLMNSVKATLAESKAILAGKPPVNPATFAKPVYKTTFANNASKGSGKIGMGGNGNGGGKPPTYKKFFSDGSGGFGGGNGGSYYRHDSTNILTSPAYYYMPGNIYHPVFFPHSDTGKKIADNTAEGVTHTAVQNTKDDGNVKAGVSCIFTKLSQSSVGTDMKPDALQKEIRKSLDNQTTCDSTQPNSLNCSIQAAKLACEQ